MKKLLIFLFMATIPLFAQDMTLDQAIAFSLQESISIKTAEDALLQAQREIGSKLSLDRTRLTLNADMEVQEPMPGDTVLDLISGSMKLSLPIVPQLSLDAGLDAKGVSFSVVFTPFASSKVTTKQEETYYKAIIALRSLQLDTALKVENTFLALMAAEQHLIYTQAYYALVQEQYEITSVLYEAGVLSYADLEESAQKVSDRRQAMYNAQRALLEKTRDSNSLLGPSYSKVNVEVLSLERLLERIEERKTEVADSVQTSIAASFSVQRLQVELEALQAQLAQTMTYRPDITLSLKGGGLTTANASVTVQASVSISPSDLNHSTKQDLEVAIARKRAELHMEQYVFSLEQELRSKSMDIAQQALDAALLDMKQVLVQQEEAKLLLNWGDRTELEVRQVELAVQNAMNQVFLQAVAYLKSLNEYLILFG